MALTDKLSAIGTAIRNKTGKTELMTLDEMPTEIASISTGADIPAELLTWDWAIDYIDYDGKWDKFIETYGSRITTTNLFTTANAFTNSKLATIPIVFNMSTTQLNHQCGSTFWGCQELTTCPTINNLSACAISGYFGLCRRLTSITVPISWEWANNETSSGSISANGIFQGCSRLRSIDSSWFNCDYLCSYYDSFYYNAFYGCKSLDELVNLPVFTKAEFTSDNAFENFVSGDTIDSVCNRLKKLTFKTNDGTAIVAKWAKQHIKMQRVGAFYSPDEATDLGFTGETKVTDATTYQNLKNNPDWWTDVIQYSRYNHNSAVETINSLPDTSAFVNQQIAASGESFADVSNLLDFSGFSTMGSSTDGGAISNLTESEIAVATSKGWTIAM